MNRSVFNRLAVLLVLAIIPAGAVFAVHGHGQGCNAKCVKCPKCDTCKLDVSEGEEEKTCFEVETEQICIPRFVFPWQNARSAKSSCGCRGKDCSSGCASSCTGCTQPGKCSKGSSGKCGPVNHNGACVRTIHKLKKSSYECPKCKYKWSVDDGKGSCTSDSCTE